MVAQMVPERDFRLPGCGDGCHVVKAIVAGVFGRSELLIHDPEDHELYGAASALQSGIMLPALGRVATGRLEVNLFTREASVDGRPLWLTPNEVALLQYLAERLGRLCPRREIASAVWPWRDFDGHNDQYHLLRVNMARIRAKLGEQAADLLVTRCGVGYLLQAIEPGALPPPVPLHPQQRGRRVARSSP